MKDEEKRKNDDLAIKLLSEQNFPAAINAGAVPFGPARHRPV
jgi:hypothetical protein